MEEFYFLSEGVYAFLPSTPLPITPLTKISFQKPRVIGKLSGSEVGGKYFDEKFKIASQKEKCGEICYHLFPPVYHSISAVSLSEEAPPFLTYVPKKHLWHLILSPGLSLAFHYFLTVPLMPVSFFPNDPRVLI